MNRLFASAELPTTTTTKPPPTMHRRVDSARVVRPPRSSETCSFFTPQHYESNYAYPLLIWLHCAGGDERQLARVLPLISTRNYVGLGVRGPLAEARRGYGWPQASEGIAAAELYILEAIAKARDRFNLHENRIYLAGYQSGGTMAFRIALRNPDQFAAAISIGGPMPEGHRPLARVDQLRNFPLLLAHCRDSQTYSIDRICQELKLFHSAGMGVTLRQYPCGDELTTQMLHDLDVWVMERVTGVASADERQPSESPNDWN
jgi:phospholipase/carboxylesterase